MGLTTNRCSLEEVRTASLRAKHILYPSAPGKAVTEGTVAVSKTTTGCKDKRQAVHSSLEMSSLDAWIMSTLLSRGDQGNRLKSEEERRSCSEDESFRFQTMTMTTMGCIDEHQWSPVQTLAASHWAIKPLPIIIDEEELLANVKRMQSVGGHGTIKTGDSAPTRLSCAQCQGQQPVPCWLDSDSDPRRYL